MRRTAMSTTLGRKPVFLPVTPSGILSTSWPADAAGGGSGARMRRARNFAHDWRNRTKAFARRVAATLELPQRFNIVARARPGAPRKAEVVARRSSAHHRAPSRIAFSAEAESERLARHFGEAARNVYGDASSILINVKASWRRREIMISWAGLNPLSSILAYY